MGFLGRVLGSCWAQEKESAHGLPLQYNEGQEGGQSHSEANRPPSTRKTAQRQQHGLPEGPRGTERCGGGDSYLMRIDWPIGPCRKHSLDNDGGWPSACPRGNTRCTHSPAPVSLLEPLVPLREHL